MMNAASRSFSAYIEPAPSREHAHVNDGHFPSVPSSAHHSSTSIQSYDEAPYELQEISSPTLHKTPSRRSAADAPHRPSTPREQEAQQQHGASSVESAPSMWYPYMNRFRVPAACFALLANGLNDAAPGALLPYIESAYGIGYATVSLIFITNALGAITAAAITAPLASWLGRAKALMLAEILLLAGYSAIVSTPSSFAVVVAAFYLLGMGMAMNVTICSVYLSNLQRATALLGAFQGCYGIGGTLAPLIATSMVSGGKVPWSRYYILTLGLAAINLVSLGVCFWHAERDIASVEEARPTTATISSNSNGNDQELDMIQRTASRQQNLPNMDPSFPDPSPSSATSRLQSLRAILANKPTVLGAAFMFAYSGAEVSISGWVTSFLVTYRHGDPTRVGYVTSGFWAGMTLGRLCISPLVTTVPRHERRFVLAITAGALILQLLVWFVPSIPGDGVAVALAGLVLGPVYPSATHTFVRLLPRRVQIAALGVIASVASTGAAMAPFVVGLVSQKAGTWVLHPVCIGLFVAMAGCWWALPRVDKRVE